MRYIKTRSVKDPVRWTENSSWIDFFVPDDFWELLLWPWKSVNIPSGISMIIEPWFDMTFKNKSWVAVKKWLQVWACVIDSDYRWEVHIHLTNISDEYCKINWWDKIIQWIIRPVILSNPVEITFEEFSNNSETERGSWWFGSTWTK